MRCHIITIFIGRGTVSVPSTNIEALIYTRHQLQKFDLKSISRCHGILTRSVILLRRHAFALKQLKSLSLIKWYALMKSFTMLRYELCTVSVLHTPTEQDEFILCTDDSSKGIGAVLSVIRHEEELQVRLLLQNESMQ